MFGRKRREHAEVQAQITAARESADTASRQTDDLVQATGWVESLVSYLDERRETNHFGQDFTIAMTPRRKGRS